MTEDIAFPEMTESTYFGNMLCPHVRDVALNYIADTLQNMEFNVVAVSGYSATLAGAMIADRMGKRLVVVRKQGETSHNGHSHSCNILNGLVKRGDKAVFIDDTVDSGKTVKYVADVLSSVNIDLLGFVTYQCDSRSPVDVCENWVINNLMSCEQFDRMYDAMREAKRKYWR